MASPKAPIAKISIPRLFGVVPRQRLFERLDENRGRPLIWIDSPPGSGKTSLIASYLEARSIPALWYQVDALDGDSAAVFHFLSLGAREIIDERPDPLPRYVPEHDANVAAFGRLYFRALFERMPEGFALVFDNYQEAPEESALQAILCAAVDEMPRHSSAICISRSDAPAACAPLRVRGAMTTLHWDSIRCTLDETHDFATSHGVRDAPSIRAIHEQAEGWAAGITLLMEPLRDGSLRSYQVPDSSPEVVFQYFATFLIDRLPDSEQQILLAVSHLPYVSRVMAERVTGHSDAEKLLNGLHRRRLFVDRRPGDPAIYTLHALFANFLRRRADQTWSRQKIVECGMRCREALRLNNDIPAVIELAIEARRWEEAVGHILEVADGMLRTARRATFEKWIAALPDEVRDSQPQILYWWGIACAQTTPEHGSAILEKALGGFEALREISGQIASLTALLKFSYVGHTGLNSLNRWLDRLLAMIPDIDEVNMPPRDQLALWGALSSSLVFARTWHPWIETASRQVEELICACEDTNVVLSAAMTAVEYCNLTGQTARLTFRTSPNALTRNFHAQRRAYSSAGSSVTIRRSVSTSQSRSSFLTFR